jgi:hypothetical protein
MRYPIPIGDLCCEVRRCFTILIIDKCAKLGIDPPRAEGPGLLRLYLCDKRSAYGSLTLASRPAPPIDVLNITVASVEKFVDATTDSAGLGAAAS